MSTRARIALALPNGKFKSVYTHWDGYPEHHAPILREHYTTAADIKALLSLGDLSRLSPKLTPPDGVSHDYESPAEGVTVAYRRDRGDKGTRAVTSVNFTALATLAHQRGTEYLYVFTDDRWLFAPINWVNGEPLPSEDDLQEVVA
jgi:hypothetical protein